MPRDERVLSLASSALRLFIKIELLSATRERNRDFGLVCRCEWSVVQCVRLSQERRSLVRGVAVSLLLSDVEKPLLKSHLHQALWIPSPAATPLPLRAPPSIHARLPHTATLTRMKTARMKYTYLQQLRSSFQARTDRHHVLLVSISCTHGVHTELQLFSLSHPKSHFRFPDKRVSKQSEQLHSATSS